MNIGVQDFFNKHKETFTCWYKKYNWKRNDTKDEKRRDNYENGFPEIIELERKFRDRKSEGILYKQDIIDVMSWGAPKGPSRSNISKVEKSDIEPLAIESSPNLLAMLHRLRSIKGIGPTYSSKVIRFLYPREAGVIDSRLVKVFGTKSALNNLRWLKLKAGKNYIEIRTSLSDGYYQWIEIINFFKDELNREKILCPHPSKFLEYELRKDGEWYAADIEMALFSYVSTIVAGK